jgi:hypothetical protein
MPASIAAGPTSSVFSAGASAAGRVARQGAAALCGRFVGRLCPQRGHLLADRVEGVSPVPPWRPRPRRVGRPGRWPGRWSRRVRCCASSSSCCNALDRRLGGAEGRRLALHQGNHCRGIVFQLCNQRFGRGRSNLDFRRRVGRRRGIGHRRGLGRRGGIACRNGAQVGRPRPAVGARTWRAPCPRSPCPPQACWRAG